MRRINNHQVDLKLYHIDEHILLLNVTNEINNNNVEPVNVNGVKKNDNGQVFDD